MFAKRSALIDPATRRVGAITPRNTRAVAMAVAAAVLLAGRGRKYQAEPASNAHRNT
jgi:hypothetical protein